MVTETEACDNTDVSLRDAINAALCGKSSFHVVEAVLKDTTNVDVWMGKQPALCRAVWTRNHNLTKLLLRYGANPDVCDDKGVSALHMAVFSGWEDFVTLLLEHNANPNTTDRHGQTPLFFAPCEAICKKLIKGKADVDILNLNGQSALHLAAHAALNETVACLASVVKPETLEAQDSKGRTAVYCAYTAKERSTVQLLQEKGASLSLKIQRPSGLRSCRTAGGRASKLQQSLTQPAKATSPKEEERSLRGGIYNVNFNSGKGTASESHITSKLVGGPDCPDAPLPVNATVAILGQKADEIVGDQPDCPDQPVPEDKVWQSASMADKVVVSRNAGTLRGGILSLGSEKATSLVEEGMDFHLVAREVVLDAEANVQEAVAAEEARRKAATLEEERMQAAAAATAQDAKNKEAAEEAKRKASKDQKNKAEEYIRSQKAKAVEAVTDDAAKRKAAETVADDEAHRQAAKVESVAEARETTAEAEAAKEEEEVGVKAQAQAVSDIVAVNQVMQDSTFYGAGEHDKQQNEEVSMTPKEICLVLRLMYSDVAARGWDSHVLTDSECAVGSQKRSLRGGVFNVNFNSEKGIAHEARSTSKGYSPMPDCPDAPLPVNATVAILGQKADEIVEDQPDCPYQPVPEHKVWQSASVADKVVLRKNAGTLRGGILSLSSEKGIDFHLVAREVVLAVEANVQEAVATEEAKRKAAEIAAAKEAERKAAETGVAEEAKRKAAEAEAAEDAKRVRDKAAAAEDATGSSAEAQAAEEAQRKAVEIQAAEESKPQAPAAKQAILQSMEHQMVMQETANSCAAHQLQGEDEGDLRKAQERYDEAVLVSSDEGETSKDEMDAETSSIEFVNVPPTSDGPGVSILTPKSSPDPQVNAKVSESTEGEQIDTKPPMVTSQAPEEETDNANLLLEEARLKAEEEEAQRRLDEEAKQKSAQEEFSRAKAEEEAAAKAKAEEEAASAKAAEEQAARAKAKEGEAMLIPKPPTTSEDETLPMEAKGDENDKARHLLQEYDDAVSVPMESDPDSAKNPDSESSDFDSPAPVPTNQPNFNGNRNVSEESIEVFDTDESGMNRGDGINKSEGAIAQIQETIEPPAKQSVNERVSISGVEIFAPEPVDQPQSMQSVTVAVQQLEDIPTDMDAEKSLLKVGRSGVSWEVTLTKTDPTEAYGFTQEAEARDKKTPKGWPEFLVVGCVVKDGLLDAWNRAHPDAEVKPGDRIVKVDACKSVKSMQKALLRDHVQLTLCRFPEQFLVNLLRKEGRDLGFKCDKALHANSSSLRILEIDQKGCLAEWNATEMKAGNWHCVVRPGMIVAKANDVEWNAEAIAQELQASQKVELHIRRAEPDIMHKQSAPSAAVLVPSPSGSMNAHVLSHAVLQQDSKSAAFSSVVANESSVLEPAEFKVVHSDGANVRQDLDVNSKRLRSLPKGTVVLVDEVKDRRAHIVKPLDGWVSTYSMDGKIILEMRKKDEVQPTQMCPRSYLITHPNGAQVRAGYEINSKGTRQLPTGSTVTVVEIRDRRARITNPVEGWVSTITKEDKEILSPMGEPG